MTLPVDSTPSKTVPEPADSRKRTAAAAIPADSRDTAWQHLYHVADRMMQAASTPEIDILLVSTSLELADLSFVLGKNFRELATILQRAAEAAKHTGDRRSLAMIRLHLGRLFYFAEKRDTAMSLFESGKSDVEALGDEDILTQAAEFIGLYYFIQGRFQEAIGYFERAAQSFEAGEPGQVINPSGPVWLSYSAAFLGQFHRAIGTLDYYRRLAVEGADKGLATTLRAVLGIILLGIKKNREAWFHLSGALQEAQRSQNALAGYFAKGGLAFHHFLEGRLKEARDWIEQNAKEGVTSGLIRQYASPIVLETLFEIHRHGLLDLKQFSYPDEFARIMREPNIHLRGVAIRLRAMDARENNGDAAAIESDLRRSEYYLKQSGDPIQLGKTYLEMARTKLRAGEREEAQVLAEHARKNFASYVDVFFPDDLRPLLTVQNDMVLHHGSENDLLDMFADVIQELAPSANFDTLLARTVKATNRFFGAERGGIFWFGRQYQGDSPLLRGACNLSNADIARPIFKTNLNLVLKAFHENRPQVLRQTGLELDPSRVKAMLCVPFAVGGQIRGVLYHDNSYVRDCFDSFDNSQLSRMAQWLTSYIDHIFEYSRHLEKRTAQHLGQFEPTESTPIITSSPVMKKMLEQVDRIAASSSTVLILGETGVGKELLARRIHRMSPRRDNPLIIVDPTVIPENLVESELFGHEKGAFTGADRRKKGRIELAHQGTLFIDEVGEIPQSIQVKLLRTLQEKTLVRIGGNQTLYSDFRLVVATNRDLAAEVAAGRFREDLYYRLNVIPVTLPPLRERIEDLPLLSRHFLSRFSTKYNRHGLALTAEDEALLTAYAWPGNIRELSNVMERAVLLSTDGRLHMDLPAENRQAATDHPFTDMPTLDEVQRRYIRFVMEKTNGRISGPGSASEILGMKRTSLYNRMNRLGLR